MRTIAVVSVVLPALLIAGCQPQAPESTVEVVELASPASPLIAVELMFRVGSIHDPAGKEGLAALTGLMVGRAGTENRSYKQLIDDLYPMASSIGVATDREVTVLSAEIHRETLDEFTAILSEVVLRPSFSESDFDRNKEELEAYLTNTLRAASDELLGLEAIQQVIFAGHPYGHAPEGTVDGLAAITLDDVRGFYRQHYTRANLVLGVAGGYTPEWLARLRESLGELPAGTPSVAELPAPEAFEGRQFTLIEKETDSVGIHFGYPLPITRADADYYPLMIANSFLGEHRTFHGRLMQQLRGERGLNYGDYSYIEFWPSPPFTSTPTPGFPRRQQYFSVWIRPVVPATAHFALRDALHEVDRLVQRGMTEEEFETTREFVRNYSKLWAQSLTARLGFLLDSRFYGIDDYISEIDRRMEEVTLDEVNAAIRKYLGTANLRAVLVTARAGELSAALEADGPSPMEYNAPPSAEVLADDQAIQVLPVEPDSIRIVPVAEMFQK